jgi:poly(3-hydroxyalkanoate) synthetase
VSTSASPIDASIATRVRPEVERTLQRSIKGLNYLFSDDPALGQTPKDTIFKRGTLALYHYRPQAREVYRIPVLFVMSLVSKAYILDLAPGQSFIEFLLKQGYDVYLIDWGVPRPEDRHLKLEDYVLDFIPDCISQIMADSGERDLSIIGYCMGGMLALMYAALHPQGPLKKPGMPDDAGQLRRHEVDAAVDGQALFRSRSDSGHAGQRSARGDLRVVRHAAAGGADRRADSPVGQYVER